MTEQNRKLKNRVRETCSHGSVRGQDHDGPALLGNKYYAWPVLLFGVIAMAADVRAQAGDNSWLNDQRTLKDFVYARRLVVKSRDNVKTFYPNDRQANFTFFDGVKDMKVEGNVLSFTAVKEKVVLGWGNYLNLQPKPDIVDMWSQQDDVVLRVRQTGASNTVWTVKCWSDGARMAVHSWFEPTRVYRQDLKGGDWAELYFKPWRMGKNNNTPPDGLEIEVQAAPGAQISLEYVKLIQPELKLYCRKEFSLPENASVWRALADVAAANGTFCGCFQHITELYVNGKQVKIIPAYQRGDTTSVDLKPYLRPGKNCVAIYALGDSGICNVFLQGDIILDSGETVKINTDDTWKVSPEPGKGWNDAGFDDASWLKAETAAPEGGSLEQVVRAGKGYEMVVFPADKGCLVVKNPSKRDLFYTQDQKAQMDVLAPPGLAAQSPALDYAIEKVDIYGACALITNGTFGAFNAKPDSIRFSMDNGVMAPGVYALSLRLSAGVSNVLGKLIREPFVVIRNQAPKIAGQDYTEGLELELEDQIDFTNPKDAHEWMESEGETADGVPGEITEANIVRKDGLVYREGARGGSSTITYRMPPLKHPGDFYLMEMEYPDNEDRETEISVETVVNGRAVSVSSAGAACGGRYFKTGQKQTVRWVQVADHGVQLFQIANAASRNMLMPGAAACSLKVYHIRNELPSVDNPATGRTFGIQMERSCTSMGYGWIFGAPPLDLDLAASNVWQALPWKGYLAETVAHYEAASRLARYLKFAGQNVHCIGAYQYDPFNTPMARPFAYDTSRILPCAKTYLANILDANDIGFYANVEFLAHYFSTFAANSQVAKGADTVWFVNRDGRQKTEKPDHLQNWLHPEVRQGFLDLMADIAGRFTGLKHFKGVDLLFGGRHLFYAFGPTDYDSGDSVDDAAFGQFKKDLGVKDMIDAQDPDRFLKRANLLNNPAFAKQYYAWRSRKGYELIADGLKELRKVNPDANMLCMLCPGSLSSKGNLWNYYLGQDLPFDEMMRRFALDCDLYKKDMGIALGPMLVGWSCYDVPGAHRIPYGWIPAQDEDVIKACRGEEENAAFIMMTNHEGATLTPKSKWEWVGKLLKSDWIVNSHKSWKNSQPSGFSVRENFVSAMIGLDPASIIFGFADGGYPLGFDQPVRKFGMMFTRLPRATFKPVLDTGATTDLVIRQLEQNGETWFYILNPGYWFADAEIEYEGGKAECVVPWQKFEVSEKGGSKRLALRLEPFDLVVFKTPGALKIKAYSIGSVSDKEIAHMTQIADRIETLLQDGKTRVAVTGDERTYLKTAVEETRRAITRKQYALAWSKIGYWRVWVLWKLFLEKAAQVAASLPPEIKSEAKTMSLPVLSAFRTKGAPALDGKAEDACWREHPFSTGFVSSDGKAILAETGVKALFDDENLYLAFICADRETAAVKANGTQEMTLFQSGDDVISIFLQPDEKTLLYYQLAFNTKGARFDQRVIGRIANFPKEFYEWTADWKTASHVGDQYWTSEVAIPFAALGLKGPGDTAWRINFHRIFRNGLAKSCAWAQTDTFHCPGTAGRLAFVQ